MKMPALEAGIFSSRRNTMNWAGRSLASVCISMSAALGAFVAQAQAQTYPTQSIIIENVVGAGGTTATTRAARAANDGYTLITGHMGTHAAAVPLYPSLAYHPEKG